MQVAVVGHSYAHELKKAGYEHCDIFGTRAKFDYVYKRGGTYNDYLDSTDLFDRVRALNPDVIVVILGGNSIKNGNDLTKTKLTITDFYKRLKEICPSSKIISAQIEKRFYEADN